MEALRLLVAKFCLSLSENYLNLDESACCSYNRQENETNRLHNLMDSFFCTITWRFRVWHRVHQRILHGRKCVDNFL